MFGFNPKWDHSPDGIEPACKEGEYAGKSIHVENKCKNHYRKHIVFCSLQSAADV